MGTEQTLNGNEDFFSATPAMMLLKMMLVEAALKGHVAAIGDCSGAFYQSPLNPDWNGKPSLDRAASRGRVGDQTTSGKAVSAFPGLKGAPRALEHSYSAKVLTSSMQMEPVTVQTVACSIVSNQVENASKRKQEGTSMTFW